MWKTWCEEKSIALEIEEHEPAELSRLREKFDNELKNKNCKDYEPDSLRVMNAAGKNTTDDMKMDDFQLCKDDNGVEFVKATEGQTKT